jgi:putative component of membrane protein insertase Oxa1/YidC/SpoIIIJ protein YidD
VSGLAWAIWLSAAGPPLCVSTQSVAPNHPAAAAEDLGPTSTFDATARLWLGAWRHLIAPADGARCGFYPSCSHYAAEALREHGPLRGAALTTARLMRPQDAWRYPVCVAGDRRFLLDPVPESTR